MSTDTETKTPTLSRQFRLTQTVVLVDGITRAGKSMMGPILASFNRVEIERLEEIVEYIGALHWMGKIAPDAAVATLRLETDYHLYNSLIGRNVNFRLADHSSVWKNPNRFRYLKRVFGRGDGSSQAVQEHRPIYQNITHDQLANFNIHHAAFGSDLRIVEMIRHPVDLVDSWLRRGWGTRFGTDPLALTFCIRYQDEDIPYYALGWEDIYLATTPAGRVIRTIASLWDRNQSTYHSLADDQKRLVLVIPFEEFIQRPWPYLNSLAEFIGSRTTRHTSGALKRQKCPRKYQSDLPGKRKSIQNQASEEEWTILQRLIDEFEPMAQEYTL